MTTAHKTLCAVMCSSFMCCPHSAFKQWLSEKNVLISAQCTEILHSYFYHIHWNLHDNNYIGCFLFLEIARIQSVNQFQDYKNCQSFNEIMIFFPATFGMLERVM